MFIKTKVIVVHPSYSYPDALESKELYMEECTINTNFIAYYETTTNPHYTKICWGRDWFFYEISKTEIDGECINTDA